MSRPSSPQALQALYNRLAQFEKESNRGFSSLLFGGKARLVDIQAWNIELDEATGLTKAGKNARVVVEHEIVVDETMTNDHGTLHGAFQALLLDSLSTSAVHALSVGPTWESGGVSTDFQIRFLNPGNVASTIRITSSTLKQGARLAVVDVEIRDKATSILLATGTHTKADVPKRTTKAKL